MPRLLLASNPTCGRRTLRTIVRFVNVRASAPAEARCGPPSYGGDRSQTIFVPSGEYSASVS
ncbi:MAG TPA: hypothetical protein VNN79_02645, partial [Actinomycetota bacterium]|nr:hypothetical protein [Actinomycetota bacterium]